MDFRERLFDLRRQAGLSQEELANLLGVTRQAVQKWEAGTSRPDMDNLVSLADYFKVSLDYLVTGKEPTPPPAPTVVNNYYNDCPEPRCYKHYEYKSKRTLFGLPLVHINCGFGRNYWARGIIAIGNIATGFISIGGIAVGLLTLGGISLGLLLALGALSIGAIAIGGVALGLMAWGGVAVGVLAVGGVAMGWLAVGGVANGVYAAGNLATASRIAVGNVASAPLAIGLRVDGARTIVLPGMKGAQVTEAVQALDRACKNLPAIVPWVLKYYFRFILD